MPTSLPAPVSSPVVEFCPVLHPLNVKNPHPTPSLPSCALGCGLQAGSAPHLSSAIPFLPASRPRGSIDLRRAPPLSAAPSPKRLVFLTATISVGMRGPATATTLESMPNFDLGWRGGHHVGRTSFTCQPLGAGARVFADGAVWHAGRSHINLVICGTTRAARLLHHFRRRGLSHRYIGKCISRPLLQWGRGAVAPNFAAAIKTGSRPMSSELVPRTLTHIAGSTTRRALSTPDCPATAVDAMTDAACFISRSAREQPFFLFLSYALEPHPKHRAIIPRPKVYAERYAGMDAARSRGIGGGHDVANHLVAGYYEW